MNTKDKEIDRLKMQLKKLAEIEESIKTFGFLTWEEKEQKQEILKEYLNY
jgi:hypothetical protein